MQDCTEAKHPSRPTAKLTGGSGRTSGSTTGRLPKGIQPGSRKEREWWLTVRVVHKPEMKKRGCLYCTDSELKKHGYATQTSCPHKECPYKVLDKYDTYEDFMASQDSRILVTEFFQTIADCYMLSSCSRKPTKTYSDGDFRRSF